MPYPASEYSVLIDDTPADETKCECGVCGWTGYFGLLDDIDGCSLTPGDPSPAGRCPECDALAYVVTPKTLAADAAPDLLAALQEAESFIAGFEGDDTQDPPVDDMLERIRAAIAWRGAEPMAQHTPGPWGYDEEVGEIFRDDGDAMPRVATVDLDNVGSFEQGLADGKLIAAGPELLAALKAIRGEVELMSGYWTEGMANFVQMADAAIAKAGG